MTNDILKGYQDAATPEFIDRLEALRSEDVLAPVLGVLPRVPSCILDVGAGTGRDAAWLASQGHSVVAVEPVEALRQAAIARHGTTRVSWLDDRLPTPPKTQALKKSFDTVLVCAVWQHLNIEDRSRAVGAIAALLAKNGVILMSVRHGPGDPSRHVYPAKISKTLKAAREHGLTLIKRTQTPSIQPGNVEAGVKWTWLVLGRQQGAWPEE